MLGGSNRASAEQPGQQLYYLLITTTASGTYFELTFNPELHRRRREQLARHRGVAIPSSGTISHLVLRALQRHEAAGDAAPIHRLPGGQELPTAQILKAYEWALNESQDSSEHSGRALVERRRGVSSLLRPAAG